MRDEFVRAMLALHDRRSDLVFIIAISTANYINPYDVWELFMS